MELREAQAILGNMRDEGGRRIAVCRPRFRAVAEVKQRRDGLHVCLRLECARRGRKHPTFDSRIVAEVKWNITRAVVPTALIAPKFVIDLREAWLAWQMRVAVLLKVATREGAEERSIRSRVDEAKQLP